MFLCLLQLKLRHGHRSSAQMIWMGSYRIQAEMPHARKRSLDTAWLLARQSTPDFEIALPLRIRAMLRRYSTCSLAQLRTGAYGSTCLKASTTRRRHVCTHMPACRLHEMLVQCVQRFVATHVGFKRQLPLAIRHEAREVASTVHHGPSGSAAASGPGLALC